MFLWSGFLAYLKVSFLEGLELSFEVVDLVIFLLFVVQIKLFPDLEHFYLVL
jgi:hypothetical protein